MTQAIRPGQRRTNTRESNYSNDYLNRTQDHASREELDQSPSKVRKRLENDPEFRDEMQNCLNHMENLPGLRAKVFNQIGQMATVYDNEKGADGILAGQATRI